MVTLATARTALRDRLDERTAHHWSDPQLDRWLNEAAKDLARRSEVLQDSADIDCSAGTQTYDAPSDAVRIHRAVWKNDNETSVYPLEYKDFQSADAVWWTQSAVTQGTPFMFTMWGVPGAVDITLYPTPAQNGTLTVLYYRTPAAAAADTDSLDLPGGWEEVAYAYAEYRALLQDRDPRWQAAKAIYDEQFAELMILTRRHSDQSGSSVLGEFPAVNWWIYDFD